MLKNWPFTHKYPGCLTTHKLRSPQAAMSWLLIIWMLFPIPIYIHLKYQLIFFVANTFRIQPFHRDWHHSSNIIIGTDITAVIYSKLESVPEHFVARWYVRNLMRFWPIFGKKNEKVESFPDWETWTLSQTNIAASMGRCTNMYVIAFEVKRIMYIKLMFIPTSKILKFQPSNHSQMNKSKDTYVVKIATCTPTGLFSPAMSLTTIVQPWRWTWPLRMNIHP
jgi:hypothetical protein